MGRKGIVQEEKKITKCMKKVKVLVPSKEYKCEHKNRKERKCRKPWRERSAGNQEVKEVNESRKQRKCMKTGRKACAWKHEGEAVHESRKERKCMKEGRKGSILRHKGTVEGREVDK